jgi:NitT/TauT family transport system substrate-binding protein
MKIRKYMLVLLGLLLAILASCSSPSPPSPPLKITFQTVWPTTGTAFIAQEKGLFAKYGVQVTLLPVIDYMESLKLYKEGRADAAFMVFGDAIVSAAEGVPTRMVYATDYSDTADFIVGQPTLKGLKDLKGKKVSFEGFNSFSHLLVLKLLEKAGVQEGEFQAANLNPTEVLEALDTGKIQAGHVYGKAITDTLAKGYKILAKAGDLPHLVMDGLMVNAVVVKTRHKEVQGLVKALAEAMDWLKHSPDEGFGIIAKHAGIPKTELETTFKGLHAFTLQENQEIFKRGGTLYKGGQEIIDFFYQKGVLVKILDLNTVIDDQFITTIGDKQ